MRLPVFDLSIVRGAGQRRVREANDLAHYLAQASHEELDFARKLLSAPPMAGGAQRVLALTSNAAALGAAQATIIGPIYDIPLSPLVLCFFHLPQIAGTTAAATITLQMRRTDTPAVISNAVHLCATADTNPGPFSLMGALLAPKIEAGAGIDVQGAASAGAGTPTGTATAPILLTAIGVS